MYSLLLTDPSVGSKRQFSRHAYAIEESFHATESVDICRSGGKLPCVSLRSVPYCEQGIQELLSVVLRSDKMAAQLAGQRIESIKDATRRELGLTEAAYARLMAGIELGRRVAEAKLQYDKPEQLNSSSAAIDFCRIHFARVIADALQEEFHIVTLNTKLNYIDSHRITVGTLDASLVHPREVFRPAIKDAASSIVLAHNHPSGDATPSREDYAVTDRLQQVGETLGITVVDHIVMARGGCISINEQRNR
jgi:DNA repair protein RadC